MNCEPQQPVLTAMTLAGAEPLRVAVLDLPFFLADVDRQSFMMLDEYLRKYPYRLAAGEPTFTLLVPHLLMGLVDERLSDEARSRAPSGYLRNTRHLGRYLAQVTNFSARLNPKSLGEALQTRYYQEVFAAANRYLPRGKEPVRPAEEAKGWTLDDGRIAIAKVLVSPFHARALEAEWNNLDIDTAATLGALGPEILNEFIVSAGMGVSMPSTLRDLDARLKPAIDVLCDRAYKARPLDTDALTHDTFGFTMGIRAALGIMHPATVASNFGEASAYATPQTQARAFTNAASRASAFALEIGQLDLTRLLVISRRVATGVRRILVQQFPENDRLIEDLDLRIAAMDTQLGRLRLKFPLHFVEQMLDAYMHFRNADVVLPRAAFEAMAGAGVSEQLALAAAVTSQVEITDPSTLIHPAGLTEWAIASTARMRLGLWTEHFTQAARTAILDLQTDLDVVDEVSVAPSGYSIEGETTLRQEVKMGELLGPDLAGTDVYDASVPLFTMKRLGDGDDGPIAVRPALTDRILKTVNLPALQVNPPSAVQTQPNFPSMYAVTFPWRHIERVIPTSSLIPVFPPMEYVVDRVPTFFYPSVMEVMDKMPVSDIPGGSLEHPLIALLDYVNAMLNSTSGTLIGAGLNPVPATRRTGQPDLPMQPGDPRLEGLRDLALGLAGQFVLQVRINGDWHTVKPAPAYIWGAPRDQFLQENVDFVVDNLGPDEDLTSNPQYVVASENARLILCMRFPLLGKTCPALATLIGPDFSAAYVPAVAHEVGYFTTSGFSTIKGRLLPFLFRTEKRWEPHPLDMVEVVVGRTKAVFAPHIRAICLSPALANAVDSSGLIKPRDNDRHVRPENESKVLGKIIDEQGAQSVDEAVAEIREMAKSRVEEAARAPVVTNAPESPVAGDTPIHPRSPEVNPATEKGLEASREVAENLDKSAADFGAGSDPSEPDPA